jgi:AmmeMemoRadiSam system protein A
MEHFILLNLEEQKQMLLLARDSITFGLNTKKVMTINPKEYSETLRKIQSSFVTLHKAGQLRGCIGALVPRNPLVLDIVEHAYAAAFSDPRFPALKEEEFDQINISISVLNPSNDIPCESEAILLDSLRPKEDGLILKETGHSATFLPSVWKQLPDKKEFLKNLKQKAGLREEYWSETISFERYSVQEFSE